MHNIISDSSFYICFLGDINEPDTLEKILRFDSFTFIIGSVIEKELNVQKNSNGLLDKFLNQFDYYEYGEIIKPFFSLHEIQKGETETIVISYIMENKKTNYITIIDDKSPREYVRKNFPKIFDNLTGTIGFLEKCYLKWAIFKKRECINTLELINQSKFRIGEEIINEVIYRIKG